ncbi:phage holin family protein [Tepidimonas taiwanensis]|uniref:Putative Actinobacterial Holin-X, holin superfamily III n=1 Tax=Tepidimonas taiwanensis TaxID=307486 RepID=A0A554XCG9_9BURK|nr:phage holin family protein [Tepidimonas taiwanensis]MCX7693243.1 phage holin family protein [Tepidimonas taiwanensis]TSE33537.1 putative Actinobacterial Holin-X, holin superfamily III [Tepidimonas taiwanensis]UBQ05762.1 phage holin family protein [Tepidimonas taiwanensis]
MPPTSHPSGDAAASTTLWGAARGALNDAAALLRVRLELLGVEAAEHALDVAQALGAAVAAAVLLSLGLGFLAVLLTVLWWDGHRLLALALFATVFLTLGAVALVWARARLRAVRWFAASAAELARDVERLRGGAD